MMRSSGLSCLVACLAIAILSAPAQAVFDLRITEVWVGQDGSDLTDDWFELRNFGDMAWTSAMGALTVNDNSGGLGTDVPVSGITEIQPGEIVIVLMEGTTADADLFDSIWSPVKPQIRENIGFADGSGLGLGAGGDSVNVYVADILEDTFTYSSSVSGVSMDVLLGADSFVGNSAGAVATNAINDAGEPAVGSPGMIPIPETASVLLLLIGLVSLGVVHRRR